MPVLRSLLIGDTPSSWTSAGFEVIDADGRWVTAIGDITIELVGAGGDRGIVAWRFDDLELSDHHTIDGVQTLAPDEVEASPQAHQNLVSHLDHVVMFTPNIQRTISALEADGFEARRVRDIPGTDPIRQQVFFWAGPTIIELVGPAEPTGDEPASLWGLAITCDDLDVAVERLDGMLGNPKPAVQQGRRIATLRTRDVGISTAIAMMTPHQSSTSATDRA